MSHKRHYSGSGSSSSSGPRPAKHQRRHNNPPSSIPSAPTTATPAAPEPTASELEAKLTALEEQETLDATAESRSAARREWLFSKQPNSTTTTIPQPASGGIISKVLSVFKSSSPHPPSTKATTTTNASKQDSSIPSSSMKSKGKKHKAAAAAAAAAENENDDEFDMFAEDDVADEALPAPKHNKSSGATGGTGEDESTTLTSQWDDHEGYYIWRVSEVLSDRYTVLGTYGRGNFSAVLKARDTQTSTQVAIKVVRASAAMRRSAEAESKLLTRLLAEDETAGAKGGHIVRLLSTFVWRNHYCMVFEPMGMNLRSVLRQFGAGVGLSIGAVQMYARQSLLALATLKRASIVHGDIKPDNILVSEGKNILKLADFGSASEISARAILPYAGSRWYRAPEVILGFPYDCGMDLWATAVTLYELYTGKYLFPGADHNDMLKRMMALKGKITNRMLRKSTEAGKHFDTAFNFLAREPDPLTGQSVVKVLAIPAAPTEDLTALLAAPNYKLDPVERDLVASFRDLLDRMLVLDPTRRITVEAALKHPFIVGSRPR